MYRLSVEKFEKNEGYEKELEERRNMEKKGYWPQDNGSSPCEYNMRRALSVDLTDEEYEAIKKSIIVHWESSK